MWEIEYSHDNTKWYKFGADGVNPNGHVFINKEKAEEKAKSFLNGLAKFTRTVESQQIGVPPCICATCTFARKHAKNCKCTACIIMVP